MTVERKILNEHADDRNHGEAAVLDLFQLEVGDLGGSLALQLVHRIEAEVA